jgi:serine phosphatase RsbU (regulator of sigma subunit)
MNTRTLLNRGALIFVSVAALLTLFSFAVIGVRDTEAVLESQRSGNLELDVIEEDGFTVVSDVSESDFADPPFIETGDTILTMGGQELGHDSLEYLISGPQEVGRRLDVEFLQGGDTLRTTLVSKPNTRSSFYRIFMLHLFRYLLAFLFVAVGILGLVRQPHSGAVRSLALFSFALPALLLTGINYAVYFQPEYSDWIMSIVDETLGLMPTLFSAAWLNLNLHFPRPRKFVQQRPWAGFLLSYGAAGLAFLITLIPGIPGTVLAAVFLSLIFIQTTAGFILLAVANERATDSMIKRQTRIVLSGASIGLVPLGLLVLVLVIFGPNFINGMSGDARLAIIFFLFISFWAIPVSFLIAFNRYGLLNVEAKLRRGTRYLITTVILLSLMFGIVLIISNLMVEVLGIFDRTPALILAVVFATGVVPIQRRTQAWLENRFYPERRRLRKLVSEFLRRTATQPDRASLWASLIESLSQGLKISKVVPVEYSEEEGFKLVSGDRLPFEISQQLLNLLREAKGPVLVDELLATSETALKDEEIDWLRSNKMSVILPLHTGDRLRGLIALDEKEGGEQYAAEEVQVLSNLADQVAVTLDNLSLLEENLEKRRLQEQLNLARDIQQGFLPQSIPDTPGIEVAATSLFSLEVAGDYYDVMSGSDGRTVFAVGDVSGKGAGAAMIMANLQASLRALVRVDADLAEMVAGINDIIFENTPTESYITFFTGVYDSSNRELRYINAGHNPPFLIRGRSGKVQELTVGGLILGMMPGASYDTERIKLQANDLLVLFTDGVTEAMNDSEEEFGEERLLKTVHDNIHLGTEEIVSAVRRKVIKFTGSEHFDDDFTMLIVRALPRSGKLKSSEKKRS